MSSQRDRILLYLRTHPGGADDDQLARDLGISPRQTVNSICRRLRDEQLIVRQPDSVTQKIVNQLVDPADPHLGPASAARARPPAAPSRLVPRAGEAAAPGCAYSGEVERVEDQGKEAVPRQTLEGVMPATGAKFVGLLRKRLGSQIFTTEESVRYTFFAALLRSGVEPEQVILEARYPSIPGARLDMLIQSPAQTPVAAVELKYDREIPSGRKLPRTQKAGKLFEDLRRLLLWPGPIARYFIYVTGQDLYSYVMNPGNQLTPVFTLPPNQSLDLNEEFFARLSNTFRRAIKGWAGLATLRVLVSEPLPQEHHVWIFTIQAKGRDY